jgi:hypothetical protein
MNGLESLHREATLKASAAETGASGASINEKLQDTYLKENYKNAALIRDVRNRKDTTKMSMISDMLKFDMQTDALVDSMMTPLSAGLKTFGSGLQGFNTGMSLIPTNMQNDIFNIKN